jgi:hypothetical protein
MPPAGYRSFLGFWIGGLYGYLANPPIPPVSRPWTIRKRVVKKNIRQLLLLREDEEILIL